MVNINLASQEESPRIEKKEQIINSGLWWIIALFVLTLASYGVLLFLQNKFDRDLSNRETEYMGKYDSFSTSDAKLVTDFNNRLQVAKGLAAKDSFKGINIPETFAVIEKMILPGSVHLASIKYDEKTNSVSLVGIAGNYNVVARQILAFKTSDKGSDYFSSVTAGKTSYDAANGNINFDVDLKLK
jgi:hypothetical protein